MYERAPNELSAQTSAGPDPGNEPRSLHPRLHSARTGGWQTADSHELQDEEGQQEGRSRGGFRRESALQEEGFSQEGPHQEGPFQKGPSQEDSFQENLSQEVTLSSASRKGSWLQMFNIPTTIFYARYWAWRRQKGTANKS